MKQRMKQRKRKRKGKITIVEQRRVPATEREHTKTGMEKLKVAARNRYAGERQDTETKEGTHIREYT